MHSETEDLPSKSAPRLSAWHLRLGRVETAFNLVAALFIFGLMLLGIWQVLGRQLFGAPVRGYIDYVELSMATFAFMGIAYCQRVGGHVRMEMLVQATRGRARWVVELFRTGVALFVVSVLIWYGWQHFLRSYELGDSTIDTQLPLWPSKLVVPLAFSLLWLRLAVQMAGFARLIRRPRAAPVAVPVVLSVEELARIEIEESRAQIEREAGRN